MATVSESTKQYFKEISQRSQDYYDAVIHTKEYIQTKNLSTTKTMVDCILMSILWVASTRDESLTEEDVCIYLNVDAEVKKGDVSVEICPEMKQWSLDEVLDYVCSITGTA